MSVTNYLTFGNEIIGERLVGGTRRNYGVDALGSITATIQGSSIENTYAYKPYGEQLQKTGLGEDPKIRWVGSRGYRVTNRAYAETYIRARHFATSTKRWATKDPKWPTELPYQYPNPVWKIDPSGLGVLRRQAAAYWDQNAPGPCLSFGPTCQPAEISLSESNVDQVNIIIGKSIVGCAGCCFAAKGLFGRIEMPPRWDDPADQQFLDMYQQLVNIALDCTQKHEMSHMDDLKDCCSIAQRKFSLRFLTNPIYAYFSVEAELSNWMGKIHNASECKAWSATLKCFRAAAGNCDKTKTPMLCTALDVLVNGAIDPQTHVFVPGLTQIVTEICSRPGIGTPLTCTMGLATPGKSQGVQV